MPAQNSIKRKIMVVIMLASTAALAVTVTAFMVYDQISARRDLARNLKTQAQMIAQNSTGALGYLNEKDARDVLDSLRAEPHIVAAALFDAQGKLFMKYPADASMPANLSGALLQAAKSGRSRMTLSEPVVQSGSRKGTLFLQSDLKAITDRTKLYAGVSILILAGSLLLVFWLSNTLQKRISLPIVELAETAREISGKKNFSVRAKKTSDDELGDLTGAFNTMLGQIEGSHAELEKSRAQLQIITDYASVLLCHIDKNEVFHFVNPAYAVRFNLAPSQVVGRTVCDLVGVQAYESFRHQVKSALTGQRVEFEMEIPYERFGHRWMHCIYVPERSPTGEVIGFVGVITDVTERKRGEQELERARDEALAASRAKDDFLAALSHELRTPLNPVLLLASEAAANPAMSADVRPIFETIAKNVSLEARLIDDLLDLTRITRDKLSLEMQPLDVHAVLQNVVDTVRADIGSKQIVLVLELGARQMLVTGDAVRLQQIFWNVLKNAVKFTPPAGQICLRTANVRDCITVQIADTGIGMTPEEVMRVFSAFTQGDHATGGSHRFGGLGLGLAISQKLVQLHSGTIEARSAGRDQGAVFIIELPLLAQSEINSNDAPKKIPAPAAAAAPGRRILLIEDHEPTRIALAHLLARRQFEVFSAGDLAEARALAAKEKIDFVISDIGLPDGNGYDLMAEFRDTYGLKGIALTGYGMEEDVARSRRAGFIAHLIKPVHVLALENALASTSLVADRKS